MSAEKRPASDAFGSSQLVVKRQKSDINLGNASTIAVVNGSTGNGALIQAVCLSLLDRSIKSTGLNEAGEKVG